MCELSGIPVPDSYQGKTLMSFIAGNEMQDRPLYSEGRLMYAVRIDNFKYVENFTDLGLSRITGVGLKLMSIMNYTI